MSRSLSRPLFLSCLGHVGALSASQRVSIVGSRELSSRCERWLEHHLSDFLRACPQAVIVSGGARGADQAAHLAAVRAGRPTIVFLPSGLNQIFPKDLERWVEPVIRAGGVFVSAYAPDDQTRNFRFEARNRLIACLGHFTFIAEASRRSGSIMTARLAHEIGRDTAALPSFPGEPAGQGCLDLLLNGTALIRDAEDLAAMMWRTSEGKSVPRTAERPTGSDGEKAVCGPHGDVGRQLTFTGSALGDNVENVINDDQAHA
jgi:DNA processing protein